MPENTESTRLVAARVPLPLAQKLKQLAALTDKTMAEIHTEAIKEYLDRRNASFNPAAF